VEHAGDGNGFRLGPNDGTPYDDEECAHKREVKIQALQKDEQDEKCYARPHDGQHRRENHHSIGSTVFSARLNPLAVISTSTRDQAH
jgi:hypothetical protein